MPCIRPKTLVRHGRREHCESVEGANQVLTGSYKPDARNFEYLLEHVRGEFRCEKEELCHVAQSLYHDHAPIKELGVASVWVERKGTMGVMKGSEKEGGDAGTSADKYGYQLRVESLKQLADIIDEATG